MTSNRLITSFDSLSEPAFQVRVSTIQAALTDNPGFPLPWLDLVPNPVHLQQEDAAYRNACLAVQLRDFSQLNRRNTARAQLTRSLQKVAAYLELVADGDIDRLSSTGFERRSPGGRPAGFGRTAQRDAGPPENFRVGLGPRAGTLQVDAAQQQGALAYEIQTTRGDPTQIDGWQQALIVSSVRRVVVDGLSPGVIWIRLRAVRPGGLGGKWTSPISVIVG